MVPAPAEATKAAMETGTRWSRMGRKARLTIGAPGKAGSAGKWWVLRAVQEDARELPMGRGRPRGRQYGRRRSGPCARPEPSGGAGVRAWESSSALPRARSWQPGSHTCEGSGALKNLPDALLQGSCPAKDAPQTQSRPVESRDLSGGTRSCPNGQRNPVEVARIAIQYRRPLLEMKSRVQSRRCPRDGALFRRESVPTSGPALRLPRPPRRAPLRVAVAWSPSPAAKSRSRVPSS